MTVNLHSTCTGADYPDLYHWWCISPLAIEPGQSHWQNLFAVTEVSLYRGSFSCISILGCKGNRSFYQGLRYIEVRSSRFPAVFARGVFLGILSKGVPPGSPQSYFRPNNVIFHTRFQMVWPLKSILRPGLLEFMSSFLRLEQQQNRFLKIHFEFE